MSFLIRVAVALGVLCPHFLSRIGSDNPLSLPETFMVAAVGFGGGRLVAMMLCSRDATAASRIFAVALAGALVSASTLYAFR